MRKPLPIRWSRKALDGLDEGLSYIAMFNPQAARSLRDAILAAMDRARAFPGKARMVPEQGDPMVREILRNPFRIIYEIHPHELRVLAVRRMERDLLAADDL